MPFTPMNTVSGPPAGLPGETATARAGSNVSCVQLAPLSIELKTPLSVAT
jgi:hypothetical protein